MKDSDYTSRQNQSRQTGITLVEVMVVIAIISIIAFIAIPSYNNAVDSQRLKAVAEATLADIRWARSESIKRNVPVEITFTTGNSWSYTVIPDSNRDGNFDEDTIRTASHTDFPSTSLTSASFNSSPSSTFNPVRGTATNGSITFTSERGTTVRITLSTLGRSKICGMGGYDAC